MVNQNLPGRRDSPQLGQWKEEEWVRDSTQTGLLELRQADLGMGLFLKTWTTQHLVLAAMACRGYQARKTLQADQIPVPAHSRKAGCSRSVSRGEAQKYPSMEGGYRMIETHRGLVREQPRTRTQGNVHKVVDCLLREIGGAWTAAADRIALVKTSPYTAMIRGRVTSMAVLTRENITRVVLSPPHTGLSLKIIRRSQQSNPCMVTLKDHELSQVLTQKPVSHLTYGKEIPSLKTDGSDIPTVTKRV